MTRRLIFKSILYSIDEIVTHWFTHSVLSTLRCSGLRTASAAAKPCQGDSLEFYLITGSIYTDQRGTVVITTIFNEWEQRLFHSYMLFMLTFNCRINQRRNQFLQPDCSYTLTHNLNTFQRLERLHTLVIHFRTL